MSVSVPTLSESAQLVMSARRVRMDALNAGPIAVASDGRPGSDGALRAAQLIAGGIGSLHAIGVIEPMPIISPEVQLANIADVTEIQRIGLSASLRAQVDRVMLGATAPSIEVRVGRPAVEIVRAADDLQSRLIVTGLGRHHMIDRMFGDETALGVLRLARVPVLAVPSDFDALPTRIVVGTDFSATGTRALADAIGLAGDRAHVHVVHVMAPDVIGGEWGAWKQSYLSNVDAKFAALKRDIMLRPGIVVEYVMLQGNPAAELLKYSLAMGADLIATGSHGHGFMTRVFLGSVSTKVLRGAHCAVLVVPMQRRPTDTADPVSPVIPGSIPIREWANALDSFTKRNMARHLALELDDPELGAQAQVRDYPLLGVTFDRHDARVEIMLGELGYDGRHLSRSIGDIRSIDLLRDDSGRDRALRISHGLGQTLLVFTS